MNVEVDAAQASQDADVGGTVVGAGGIVVGLVGLVIQLLLHVRIQQVEVVDVVDLDLRRQGCSVAQQDGPAGGCGPSRSGLRGPTRGRAHILLVAEVDGPGEVIAQAKIWVRGPGAAFVPLLLPLLVQP